ncbi:MAG: TadE/TadG family type IV pilus assembly protein [Novosphingobium sp.]
MNLARHLERLIRDDCGTMVIETAIVTPVLVLLSLGAYQVSTMVAKQSELDSAAAEGAAIALAAPPDTSAKLTTLHDILVASTGLPSGNITVTAAYRCNAAASYVTTACSSGQVQATYVKIYMTTTYTPTWTQWGIGSPITYRVTRYVQYSQTDVP